MYIYSAKNNAFHPIELKQRYIDAGSWPDDGVEISDEDYYRFINAVNKRWVAGDNGYPKLVDIPPPSPAKLQQQAKQQKLSLRQRADIAIAPLQYAVDLDMATDVELSMLTEWKKYMVLLNRVDCSAAPNIDWPKAPE
ncbi:tail fiber assembly protein [Xenorhabdus sp. TH1]|uniref:tail fiber assembly protein n=1 Tax=Xenorhabdus sp. TH1 TaxID=3130166 RepID=UPI0030CD0B5D